MPNMDRLVADLLHQLALPANDAPEPSTERAGQAPALVESLTPREMEVLALLCLGQTNREIAAELDVATGTVKYYTGQI
jgi:DNA-binding NarL/FixJ family response regulator